MTEHIGVSCVSCGANAEYEDGDGLWCGHCGIGYFCLTCYKRHEEGWHYLGSPQMLEDNELGRLVREGLIPDEATWGLLRYDDWYKLVEHIAAQQARIAALEAQVVRDVSSVTMRMLEGE